MRISTVTSSGNAVAFRMGVAMFTAIFMGAAPLPSSQAGDQGGSEVLWIFLLSILGDRVTSPCDTPVDALGMGRLSSIPEAALASISLRRMAITGSLLPPSLRFSTLPSGNGGSSCYREVRIKQVSGRAQMRPSSITSSSGCQTRHRARAPDCGGGADRVRRPGRNGRSRTFWESRSSI